MKSSQEDIIMSGLRYGEVDSLRDFLDEVTINGSFDLNIPFTKT